MYDQENLKQFLQEMQDGLYARRPLTGKDGVLTPLIKVLIESALEGEMIHHLKQKSADSPNRRNGRTKKNLKSSIGRLEIFTPRDRAGTFDPQILPKGERKLPGDLDEKIIALYGAGLGYSDIQAHMAEMYGLSVGDALINSVTDQVIPAITAWQSRPLEQSYVVVWMDAMYFRVREDGRVVTKAIYSILGLNCQGMKEVLGLYIGGNESASFWSGVLSELRQRGVEDILIACIDNLKGFSQAIEAVFPNTEVQLCVVHQIRNTLKYTNWKNGREMVHDMRAIYQAPSKALGEAALEAFANKWRDRCPKAVEGWERNWERLSHFFNYPPEIRRIVYTTNTVEGYHRSVRKVTKSKGAFTSEMAVMKLVYLATINFQKRWSNQINNWRTIQNQLSIYFENRISL